MHTASPKPEVAIACGGTGGHLFPGIAVAGHLLGRGCRVTLLISPKEVDQAAVRKAQGMDVLTLPAVGFTQGRRLRFCLGFLRSFLAARRHFANRVPAAALGMGGFTSAPPILAAKQRGAATFLHESNSVPGRANRWLSRFVLRSFVGFPAAASRLRGPVSVTGTPVRTEFAAVSPAGCRARLGFDPDRPLLVITGGSQGASALNHLVVSALPLLSSQWPGLQFLHLTGPHDSGAVAAAYAQAGLPGQVHAFLDDMPAVLGAASVVISRAGASSLAEIAALRVPAVLVPFPGAVDNHQFLNARAFVQTGAARLLEQASASPESLLSVLRPLLDDAATRQSMAAALAAWHVPGAAEQIAEEMLRVIRHPSALEPCPHPHPGSESQRTALA